MEGNGKANGNGHHAAVFAGIGAFALPQTNAGLNLPNGIKGVQQQDRLQENLVADIADAFVSLVKPLGYAVTAAGKHDCVAARAVRCPEASMTTVALRGIFSADENCAQEFYRAIGHSRECVR
jgi:GTP cyclohydrolase I